MLIFSRCHTFKISVKNVCSIPPSLIISTQHQVQQRLMRVCDSVSFGVSLFSPVFLNFTGKMTNQTNNHKIIKGTLSTVG